MQCPVKKGVWTIRLTVNGEETQYCPSCHSVHTLSTEGGHTAVLQVLESNVQAGNRKG
jgi:hypothetical protein